MTTTHPIKPLILGNLLILFLVLMACEVFGQTKPTGLRQDGMGLKADTTKPKYNYFAVIPISDYQQLAGALNEYKLSLMYNPAVPDAQKVQLFKQIEAYLKELPGRVRIDSVKKTK